MYSAVPENIAELKKWPELRNVTTVVSSREVSGQNVAEERRCCPMSSLEAEKIEAVVRMKASWDDDAILKLLSLV